MRQETKIYNVRNKSYLQKGLKIVKKVLLEYIWKGQIKQLIFGGKYNDIFKEKSYNL